MLNIEYLVKKNKLNDLEKNILFYIQNKISQNYKISIRETARDNYTSTSVIYSCIKKIGFRSFPDLIFHMRTSKTKLNELDNFNFSIPKNIINYFDDSLIMFCSTGIGNNITSYMNERISLSGRRSIANAHLQLFKSSNPHKIILWVVSESGETQSILDIMEVAQKNSVPIISFIGKSNSTIEKLSDFSFILKGEFFFADVISTFEKFILKI